jgi:hypothetical protein
MLKRLLPLLLAPLLLAGCKATFTNLTPRQQSRNAENLYPVEVAMASRQQTLRWESIRPKLVVGNRAFEMRATPLMTNRWEGLVPVSLGTSAVKYHYQFDYECNAFGKPKAKSVSSSEYTLRITQ